MRSSSSLVLSKQFFTNIQEFLDANPDAKLISLGIGDTTHPLPGPIADAMAAYAKGLGTLEG